MYLCPSPRSRGPRPDSPRRGTAGRSVVSQVGVVLETVMLPSSIWRCLYVPAGDEGVSVSPYDAIYIANACVVPAKGGGW